MAYLTNSIWSLAIGVLISAVLQCVLSHTVLKGPRARFRLEPRAVKELLSKGKWVLLSSLLGYVAMSGDRLLLGGLVDAAALGLYSIAFGLASIAPGVLSALLAKVVFPAFSEVVRDRPDELGRTYRKFQVTTDICVGLLAGLMFVASDVIVTVLYDPRYQQAGLILAYLAVGSIGVRFFVVEQIYVAIGKPSLLALAILPRVVVLVAGLPIGYALAGLQGALTAVVLSQVAHWPLAIWFRSRHRLGQLKNDFALPLALVVGAGLGLGFIEVFRWLGR